MKIEVSRFAGFCKGVKRAYDMVMGLDMEKIKKPVFVLGDLVHNKEVVKKIEEKGIGILDRNDLKKKSFGEIGTLIVTAHGDDPSIFEEAKKRGIEILDTTCPNVVKVQRLARAYVERGNQVVLIGDRDHKEVKGIFGWGFKKIKIVSNLEEVKRTKLDPKKKVIILSQTTQNEKKVKEIIELFRENFSQNKIEYVNTICLATEKRQKEVKNMANSFDAVVVIGDKRSANSNRLFEIALETNSESFFVQKVSQLDGINFGKYRSVLIAAGASTPDWLILEIKEKISQISS